MPAIEKRKIKKLKKIRVLLQNRRSNTGLFRARVRSHMLYPYNVYYNCPSRIDSYGQGKHVYILKVHCLDMHICLRT